MGAEELEPPALSVIMPSFCLWGYSQLEEVQPQRTGCHSHDRLLVKCRDVPDPKARRYSMPEFLLGEKAGCSLVRVTKIRQSLSGAGVCLVQSTLQLGVSYKKKKKASCIIAAQQPSGHQFSPILQ